MFTREKSYRQRVVDAELQTLLKAVGAVVIEGPKACGKTETAKQHANSVVSLDRDANALQIAEIAPESLLRQDPPLLLDEWQLAPLLWNEVRHQVDERAPAKGQFILTGSATPADDVRRHSGAGRFVQLQMRPMSLYERGLSSGEVSFAKLMTGAICVGQGLPLSVPELASVISVGGWPGLLETDEKTSLTVNRGYLEQIVEVDLPRVAQRRRDPVKLRRLLQAVARNVGNQVSVTKLAGEAGGENNSLDRGTVDVYLDELARLKILEDLPAWNAHLRSRDALLQLPKRMFVDPSLAVAALGADPSKLLNDLEYMGFLFENLVIRDLRVLSQPLGGRVAHARTRSGREVDAVVELPDGAWAAFEVKLGGAWIDAGAASLLSFARAIDNTKSGEPVALAVIVPEGYAYRRPDGVTVLPLSALGV